jgi:hypothetical protein
MYPRLSLLRDLLASDGFICVQIEGPCLKVLRDEIFGRSDFVAELSRKREELAGLQARLAEFELQLLTLRLELTEFEALYHPKAGALYAELDEVEALIAERLAQLRPLDTKAAEAATDARKRADDSHRVADESARALPAHGETCIRGCLTECARLHSCNPALEQQCKRAQIIVSCWQGTRYTFPVPT